MKGVSDFWASKVERGQDGKYTASNMTGPVSLALMRSSYKSVLTTSFLSVSLHRMSTATNATMRPSLWPA